MSDPDDEYGVLRTLRAEEKALNEKLVAVREKISTEVRALYNGAHGRPKSTRQIADAVGMSKAATHNWLKRGSGWETTPRTPTEED